MKMNDSFSEAIEYRGFNIEIHNDFDPMNPIEEFDMLGVMVCCHDRYTLGHKQYKSGKDCVYETLHEFGYKTDQLDHDYDCMDRNEFIDKYMRTIERFAIVLPLYLYDHSGITISTTGFSCPWDSGQLGFIYITKEAIKKEFEYKIVSKSARQKAIKIMQSEVKTYDQFLTGMVFGFNIEPTDKNKSIECDDSCWGFYGSDHKESGLLEMAENSIDCSIKQYKEKCIAECKERKQMNQFMQSCWAI
jgi:hypothetical protein